MYSSTLLLASALEGGGVASCMPCPLYHWEIPGTHSTGGCLGARAGLDGCGKFHLHRDLIPGPSGL
jgi:hypothetical protein